MNATSHRIRFAAACLLLALRPAVGAEPSAAPESAAAVQATTQVAVSGSVPPPQGAANSPIGAASDAAVPASPPALDWSYAPRRSFQARRR
jgi:hypothetical protein